MSQTTEIQIQNQNGLSFRTKLNQMLSALNTGFSGTTEPTVTEADMLWFDTSVTPNVLRRRDSSNTSWEICPVIQGTTNASPSKATPVDADLLPLVDSADSLSLKKLSWANIKAALDTRYYPLTGGTLNGSLTTASTVTAGTLVSTGTTATRVSAGTTAQRPDGSGGDIRFNTTFGKYEGHNGTLWSSIGGGATGGGSDAVFHENDQNVTVDYTITSGKNAMTAGPITINNGVTVTVPTGSVWTIV